MHIEPDAMQRKIIRLQIACGQAVRSFVCIYLFILHCASSHHLNLVPQAQMCYFLFFTFPLNLAVSFTQAISQISTSFLFKGTRCRRSRGNVCSETGWGRRLCTTRCWLCGCSTACPNNSAHDGFLQPVQWDWGALGVPCFCWWEAVGFQGGLGGEGRNKMGVVRSLSALTAGAEGKRPLRPLKVASLKQGFDFHTFHASPCSGVQGWYYWATLSAVCSTQGLLGQGHKHGEFIQIK